MIHIEFYGMARLRAGVAQTTAAGPRLGDVLADLGRRFPGLAETCFEHDHFKPGFLANLGGDRFVTDPDTRLNSGDSLLILSADAGG
jgi:molybdopterin converting factor small subunit